ncbi:phage tail tape measure protein [Xenorhabdus innexi]|uniref:Phage tail tape measure protein n=1 Tax=Xenorhabdus innexi TaxID=290109 RepID=A0A1N6N0W5_9GAMM|nr:phage tail tape measure protein [Xenorhabdus innexi]PHM31287.1 phage tail tape measure protein [Xenorhabdus innexi]SIP74738.1 putative tapemeasure protein [Xenorhabdus innexi]
MANLSSLTVGLLVNATSFKSQIADAYRYAGRESERFADKADKDGKKLKKTYSSLANQIASVSGKLALLTGTGFSLGSIITHTRKYGQALSDLSAITGATGAQLKQLNDDALRLGRTTEFGATGIAQALKLMASAKPELLKNTQALTQATEKAVVLAQASGVDLPEATKALALSLNQFGVSAAQADRYINVLAAGAKYGASEINETAQAIKNGGTMAAQAGISFETLNAAIQVLAKGGIKGAEAGVAIRNVVLALEKSTDKKLKPSVVGLEAALEHLKNKQLSTAQAATLFGRANLSAASQLVTGRRELGDLTLALTDTQVAYDQAAARANNLSADLDVLGKAFEVMAIKVGMGADGPLRTGVQGATNAVNALSENFNTVANVALHTLIPVMATKLTAGLRENISTWRATEKAMRNTAKQQADTARKTIEQANATITSTEAQRKHIKYLESTNRQHGIYVNYARDKNTLFRQETEAYKQREKATKALEVANRRLSFSYQALSRTMNFASSAWAMIGGSFGAAMLAGSAVLYFSNSVREAKVKVDSLKGSLVETIAQLQQLSKIKLEIRMDDLKEDIQLLEKEQKRLYGESARYSQKRQSDMEGIRDSGLGFLADWFDESPAEYEKHRRKNQGDLEDIAKDLAAKKESLKNAESILLSGKYDQPSKPDDNNQTPWTGEGGGSKGKGGQKEKSTTQIINQYQQLRFDIERAHSTSLGRILLNEKDVQRKLDDIAKSGLVSQSEIERLKALNAENHQKQRLELAERYAPAKALIRQEAEASKELKALYAERLLTEQEYLLASKTLNQTSVKDKLAEQARALAVPQLHLAGEVDPVIQLKNQLTEQTALYEAYYRNNRISKERFEQLTTAAGTRSRDAQLAAAKELYGAQGDFQRMQLNLLDVVEQRTGNALTGMLTGSKSFSESMRELSASLAQSIIQDLMRIAMQALITKAISGFFGGGGMANMGTQSLASAGGSMGSIGSGTTLTPAIWKSPIANAKGGVYQSADLSQYSGQIISSPTLFKFAKGGGLMGEAGPEAILPLKRGSDGRLGVETSGGTSNQTTNQVSIVIQSDGNHDVKTTSGFESAGQDIAKFIDQRFKTLLHKSLGQGGELSVAIKGGRR